jgi:hypothetical protein
MMRATPLLLLLSVTLPGCAVYREATSATINTEQSWRAAATDKDRERLRKWRQSWDEALAQAKGADDGAIARDAALFDPDRAQPDPLPPVGNYRCRTIKIGTQGEGMPKFTAYPAFDCSVTMEGTTPRIHKHNGSQRPTGFLFPDSNTRQIFLGTLVLGDETAPLRYGIDANRDMAGYVERVADKRWRLVLPYPHFESLLDVIELVPAS